MNKIYLASLTLILGMVLFGCDMTSENTENANGIIDREEKEAAENNKQSNTADVGENNESNLLVNTGSAEKVINKVEGMDVEVKVINYEIQPFDISYQLHEAFDVHEVNRNQVTYSNQNDEYNITLEIIENIKLEKAVSALQESFEEAETYEVMGDLESTPLEENDLRGKMQFFAYPMIQGFYAYEIDEHVLAITYQYPVEAGDGMGPLLEAFRKTIK